LDDIYTASSGTVTVTYLGDDVSVNYTSTWDPIDVAATLVNNINTDNDIQLTATVENYSNATVRVTEKRTGDEYNDNPVYLNDSKRSNHIKLSDSVIYLGGGSD
jgi:phage tail sheath gpL-like